MADDETRAVQAATFAALLAAGFRPGVVEEAVRTGVLDVLWRDGSHRGLSSVQLQPPQEPC